MIRSFVHVRPAGPLPTTATLCPFFALGFSNSTLFSRAQSPTKRSSLPIAIGSNFLPMTHEPSHCDSCGQTRPHTDGRAELRLMTRAASSKLPSATKCTNCGISILTGQALTHCGFLQFKQRCASMIASSAS